MAKQESQIYVDDFQGAARKSMSCLHSSMLLREVVAYNRELDNTVFVGLLDTKKAFDTVWHAGLMYKLSTINIDTKMWKIIYDLYSDFKCCVLINGKRSSWFSVTQGVHQGAPMSLWLYSIFINDLIVDVKNAGHGATLFDMNIPCVAYADDLALVSTSHSALQALLRVAYLHSKTWKYEFNATKCEVVIYGKK